MPMKPIRIIFDTDIADDIDDAFALKYALSLKELEILGVTIVYKNVHQRAQIAKHMLELEERADIGIFAGLNQPIKEQIHKFDYEKEIDGQVQLLSYNSTLKDIKYEETDAISFMLNMIEKHNGDLYIVAIGPLTNIATAIQKNPETFKKLKGIYTMGGTPLGYKEWNILVDPEAAKIVYEFGVPIFAVGVDITQKTTFTDHEFKKAQKITGKSNDFLVSMMMDWFRVNNRNPVMHDSLPIDAIINSNVQFEGFDVEIPLDDENKGKTISTKNKNSHVKFATSLNRDLFMDYFFKKIEGDKK